MTMPTSMSKDAWPGGICPLASDGYGEVIADGVNAHIGGNPGFSEGFGG